MPIPIAEIALKTIELEKESVAGLSRFINADFVKAVELIATNKGRLVVSGIGKSAIIAQKIVATLNSTGTPSLFMHAADAIHGDLGMIQPEDLLLLISKSGESPEIKVLVPLLRSFGNRLIGMVGQADSFLAKQADLTILTTVEQEACPHNLAPTTSTTAQLVMGDALAICLMELKGFRTDDFARYHPGGMLGKKLYLRVEDLSAGNEQPSVRPDQSLREVIVEMTARRLGVTAVVGPDRKLIGIITDGDLRRMLEKNPAIETVSAGDIMNRSPKFIEGSELAVDAMELMRRYQISQLAVVKQGQYAGILHLHDLMREGIL